MYIQIYTCTCTYMYVHVCFAQSVDTCSVAQTENANCTNNSHLFDYH